MRVVIIGGVAAGPKVAAKVIRLKPDADVTIVDRSILVRLRRKRPEDSIDRFTARSGDSLIPLARTVARWVADNSINLSCANPDVPE